MDENNLKNLVKELLKKIMVRVIHHILTIVKLVKKMSLQRTLSKTGKTLNLPLVRDESRDTAIRVAKVLVRDLELFGDVLESGWKKPICYS